MNGVDYDTPSSHKVKGKVASQILSTCHQMASPRKLSLSTERHINGRPRAQVAVTVTVSPGANQFGCARRNRIVYPIAELANSSVRLP